MLTPNLDQKACFTDVSTVDPMISLSLVSTLFVFYRLSTCFLTTCCQMACLMLTKQALSIQRWQPIRESGMTVVEAVCTMRFQVLHRNMSYETMSYETIEYDYCTQPQRLEQGKSHYYLETLRDKGVIACMRPFQLNTG